MVEPAELAELEEGVGVVPIFLVADPSRVSIVSEKVHDATRVNQQKASISEISLMRSKPIVGECLELETFESGLGVHNHPTVDRER